MPTGLLAGIYTAVKLEYSFKDKKSYEQNPHDRWRRLFGFTPDRETS